MTEFIANIWNKIHNWLIIKLIGTKKQVIINATIDFNEGLIVEAPALVCNTLFKNAPKAAVKC